MTRLLLNCLLSWIRFFQQENIYCLFILSSMLTYLNLLLFCGNPASRMLNLYLLKWGTIWNHLKPAILWYFLLKIGYSQVKFVLTPDWLKFGTGVHCFKFKVYFSKMFLTHIFSEQIWSQNLKFSKLTEIWYRGTLHCFMLITILMLIFCKFLVTPVFWANLVP